MKYCRHSYAKNYTVFLVYFLSESSFFNKKLIDADFVVKCQNEK